MVGVSQAVIHPVIHSVSETPTETETLTTGQLCDRYGWNSKNAARSAKRLGWVPVGSSGRQTLWRNTTPDDV